MAKPFHHPIVLEPNESFTCREWRIPRVQLQAGPEYCTEYAIKLILEGRGMRIIGDNISLFREGDLILLGPNLPNGWQSDSFSLRKKAHFISSTFHPNFLGAEFFATPEMAPVRRLLTRAQRGLSFSSKVSREATPLLLEMSHLKGWKRMRLLLDLLDLLAAAPKAKAIVSPAFSPALNERDGRRLTAVCKYICASYERPIRRKEAAKVACLSETRFSSFFHKQMGITFEAYIVAVRIGQACHKLAEKDVTIAEVAFETGFNTLSNFNLHFRRINGMTPREYRRCYATNE